MRNSFAALVFGLAQIAPVIGFCEDSLFSQVPIESVFSPTEGSADAEPRRPGQLRPQALRPLRGAAAISDVLRQAGFEPKELSSEVVSISLTAGEWSFPVLVTASEDRGQLSLIALLGSVKDEKQVPADKLLSLLSANRDYAPAYFSFSSKRKRTELHLGVDNQAMTGETLKREIDRLASIAKETQNLWQLESADAAAPANPPKASAAQSPTPATQQPGQQQPATKAAPVQNSATTPPASPSLVGKWSAARSEKEAFAMQLNADGTFVLVHVADGKQNRSTGKFTFSGQQLSIVGSDGTRLSGTISQQSQQEFHFLPQGATTKTASLVFKRAS